MFRSKDFLPISVRTVFYISEIVTPVGYIVTFYLQDDSCLTSTPWYLVYIASSRFLGPFILSVIV